MDWDVHGARVLHSGTLLKLKTAKGKGHLTARPATAKLRFFRLVLHEERRPAAEYVLYYHKTAQAKSQKGHAVLDADTVVRMGWEDAADAQHSAEHQHHGGGGTSDGDGGGTHKPSGNLAHRMATLASKYNTFQVRNQNYALFLMGTPQNERGKDSSEDAEGWVKAISDAQRKLRGAGGAGGGGGGGGGVASVATTNKPAAAHNNKGGATTAPGVPSQTASVSATTQKAAGASPASVLASAPSAGPAAAARPLPHAGVGGRASDADGDGHGAGAGAGAGAGRVGGRGDAGGGAQGRGGGGDSGGGDDDVDVVRAFTCPITDDLMEDPVMCPEGQSFERAAIEDWLRISKTNPVTRNPLTKDMLFPNRALRDSIQLYKARGRVAAAAH
jgi:hypothetical protein